VFGNVGAVSWGLRDPSRSVRLSRLYPLVMKPAAQCSRCHRGLGIRNCGMIIPCYTFINVRMLVKIPPCPRQNVLECLCVGDTPLSL